MVTTTIDQPVRSATPRYDREAFAAYLRRAKGTMSSREFALATGLSESFIAKAVSGRQYTRPTKRTVMKLMAQLDESADKRTLCEAAGYEESEIQEAEGVGTQNAKHISAAAAITACYGRDIFSVMGEMMRALSEQGVVGDISAVLHRSEGYFEINDLATGDCYLCINGYLQVFGDEVPSDEAAYAIALSIGLTYSRMLTIEGIDQMTICVLTDDRRVYDGCKRGLPSGSARATVILLTKDHAGFCSECVLGNRGESLISLVD